MNQIESFESRINPNQKHAVYDFEIHELQKNEQHDTGTHYRFEHKGIKLDPFRIAQIYGMTDFCMMTILKKTLCAGNRGHKDFEQDLKDIICAAQRKLEMLSEDNNDNSK